MDWDSQRIQAQIGKVEPSTPARSPVRTRSTKAGEQGFAEALKSVEERAETPNVHFSAHAAERLMERGITIDQTDLEKIDAALDRASEKGAQESLFVLRDLALVVSVPNRTVITALHGEGAKGNVFTQIDSAVLL